MRGLAGLGALKSLTLRLSSCEQLENVEGLQGFEGLGALQTLELYLSDCRKLERVDELQGCARPA